MEPSTQKLIHTFGALADLGQEVANAGDFNDMVQTSMHLLLGTLAIRRGAVTECAADGALSCVAIWGLGEKLFAEFVISEAERKSVLENRSFLFVVKDVSDGFFGRYRDPLNEKGIELALPMIVRGQLTGFVLLGGKASG